MPDDLIERLAAHKLIGAAPCAEIEWIAAHGKLRTLAAGEALTRRDAGRVDGLFLVLSGHLVFHLDRGAGRHKVIEWRAGEAAGLLPYSRLVTPPGDTIAEEATEICVVHRDDLPEMIQKCHEVTTALVHVMLGRARQFTASDLRDEKMVSLGKLSAGLAHELNNPAAAIARGAKLLSERIATAEAAAGDLGALHLAEGQRSAIDRMREVCAGAAVEGVRSPLEEADREESIADWLAERGLDPSLSSALAETSVTVDALDTLSKMLDGAALPSALRSVAAGCSARQLSQEIQQAAARISDLVSAVKGFTHMDQATAAEPVDIGEGLRQTVAVLRSKARSKALGVSLEIEADLPNVRGFPGELNQVWANLIDNALDAAPEAGQVEIRAARHADEVVVSVVDNGAGIPPEVLHRIFDPFFTTKPLGKGTGLGLDIAHRLVREHSGEIQVDSVPGRTQFRVSLPVVGADPDRGPA